MAEQPPSIQGLRDRLTELLADWGSELSGVLKELEEQRARVAELEQRTSGRADEVDALNKRLAGQENLIDTLKADAEEASKLRKEVRSKDLEFERVRSELDSKKELIGVLRRDAENTDRLKADVKLKDGEIAQLRSRAEQAERELGDVRQELDTFQEAAADRERDESTEVEALRAELDARKAMIKSLRADQGRVERLEQSLEEKREIVEQLETSLNRHANTIADLKRSAESWKRKYQTLKGHSSTATTSTAIPSLSDTDVRVIEELESRTDGKGESTIAIDMRRSLLEARRAASQNGGDK